MRDAAKKTSINRIIDANLNRAKEGLRVCEEITRFILDNRGLTAEFKSLRHGIDSVVKKMPLARNDLLRERQSMLDVGRKIYVNELKRKGISDVFSANMQRAKESIRVLEEFSKLISRPSAVRFKKLRYRLYDLEKNAWGTFPKGTPFER